uniref:Cytochrome P450 94A1-like n=1 Tax=Nelumbo nucifera TaxID=4432 RepID=A0A822YPM1_NELNU|nr:TPA_asm: hypothetical protein HUJ06_012392 [Nelumbo nucifera]
MIQLELLISLPFILPLFFFLISGFLGKKSSSSSSATKLPMSYPLIGSYIALSKNRNRWPEWIAEILRHSPSGTFVLHRPFGVRQVLTANPSNVQHILKTQFYRYPKGHFFRSTLSDLLGDGIFTADGDSWKSQRQISSHAFNTKSLHNFVETVVDTELTKRLIPILSAAAADKSVINLQDILQRFAFDNICKIAFGFDPEYLSPSFPSPEFTTAFDSAIRLSSERFGSINPALWKLKRAFGIGSEKQLQLAVSQIRGFAQRIVREKKRELDEKSSLENGDLLSRILNSGHVDENLVTDLVISFILAGRDTTSAALTWFFWLISSHSHVEEEILREITENPVAPGNIPSLRNGKDGGPVGFKLAGFSARAVAREGRSHRKMELRGEGSVHLSGVSSGTQDMSRKGHGILADEAGGGRCSAAVPGCAGDGGRL